MSERIYTLAEAEGLMGIPEATLRKQLNRGQIIGVKIAKGQREIWGIPESSINLKTIKKDKSRYEQLVDLWQEQQASGWHTGKPIGQRGIDNNLDGLKDFWKNLDQQPDLSGVTLDNLKRAITSLSVDYDKRNCHYALKERMYKGLMSFSKLLIREKLMAASIILEFKDIKPKRVFPPRKTVLQDDSFQKLLQANQKLKGGRSEFDVALGDGLIAVMCYAGLRRNEVIQLTLKDVDLKTGYLYVVNGKGHKDRPIGICEELDKYFRLWLKHRPKSSSYRFFLQEDGLDITKHVIQNRIYRLAKKNEIDITAHGMRRTFATRNSDKGIPLHKLMLTLGHNNLETTQGYLMTDAMEAAAAIRGERKAVSIEDLKAKARKQALFI